MLDSSRRKLARAKKHIADVDREVKTFLDGHPYAEVCEPDPQRPAHVTFKIKLIKALPTGLAEIVGDATNNLRAALDHAGYDMAVAAGKIEPRHAYFPIYPSAIEFEKSARGLCKDVPDEIFSFFRALQPYKGGNDLLFALNQIVITDKHKMITAMSSAVLRTGIKVEGVGYFECPHPTAHWDRDKNEIIIATFAPTVSDGKFSYEFDFFAFVEFDEVEIVRGKPVVPVLDQIAGIVEGILDGLEAEARRVGIVD